MIRLSGGSVQPVTLRSDGETRVGSDGWPDGLMSPPDLTQDRVVFAPVAVAAPRFLRWAGPLLVVLHLALWVFIGEFAWQVAFGLLMGSVFTAQAYPHLLPKTGRWDTYVSREKVGWSRFLRQHTVELADIVEVRLDAESARWATKVVLTTKGGTTHEIPTFSPADLIEVLEIRRGEAVRRSTGS